MTISTAGAVAPVVKSISGTLQGSVSRSEFRDILRHASDRGLPVSGLNILQEGTILSAGLGELRGALGPYTYTQLPYRLQRISQLNLFEAAGIVESSACDATLIIEPRFYRASLWQFHGAPLESLRSVVFRLVKDNQEVFRADFRSGNRSHNSNLRTFYYDDSYADLASSLIELALGRQITYRDFSRELLESRASEHSNSHGSAPQSAPEIDCDPNEIGLAKYSYVTRIVNKDAGTFFADELGLLADQVYARAAVAENFEALGVESEHAVLAMYPAGPVSLRKLHNKLEEIGSIFRGRVERRPPHTLWAGLKSAEVTPRGFLRQARAMEDFSLRFELHELQPRFSYQEFLDFPRFPELAFHSPESGIFSGRTVIALQDKDGYCIQYNPNVQEASQNVSQSTSFIDNHSEVERSLRRCSLIFGGDDHPNLGSRRPLINLLPFNKLQRLQRYVERFYTPA